MSRADWGIPEQRRVGWESAAKNWNMCVGVGIRSACAAETAAHGHRSDLRLTRLGGVLHNAAVLHVSPSGKTMASIAVSLTLLVSIALSMAAVGLAAQLTLGMVPRKVR